MTLIDQRELLASNHYSSALAFFHDCGKGIVVNSLDLIFLERLRGTLSLPYEIMDDYINYRIYRSCYFNITGISD